jgi:hypothetical protein
MPEILIRPGPVPTPKARRSVTVESTSAARPLEQPVLPTTPPGWLRVRVTLPVGLRDHSFLVIIVKGDGNIEKNFSNDDDDQADLHPLAPGRKAVLVFSPTGSLETVATIVTIAEGVEFSLELTPPASFSLGGEVVDAFGKPVLDVDVEIEETLSYGEGFVPLFPDGIISRGLAEFEPGGRGLTGGRTYSCSIWEKGFVLTRAFRTDARGRFVLPAGQNQAAVPVRILREGKLLKEEVLLAPKAPLRLVVPGVIELPKK